MTRHILFLFFTLSEESNVKLNRKIEVNFKTYVVKNPKRNSKDYKEQNLNRN